jgi:hypothetical protein
MPDFWYIIGYDYEITIFKSLDDARKVFAELNDDDYYSLFGGMYGEQFSGWVERGERMRTDADAI